MKTIAIEHTSKWSRNAMRIEWNLGKRCNFNCSYCDEFTHDNHSKHLPFEIAKRTIDTIIASAKNKDIRISLTGGEPCVNPDIEEIIKYMHSCGIKVGITTNGSRTVEFYKKIIPYLSTFLVSYHMEYHGADVLPGKIIDCFAFAKGQPHHIHTHVHMMMLPSMFADAKLVIDLFQSHNITTVIRRIRPAYVKGQPDQIARPFFNGISTLKFGDGGPIHDDTSYYTDEELKALGEYNA